MNLVVGVGTVEQRRLMRSELEPLLALIEEGVPDLAGANVIIPADFDDTVNWLEGTSSYRSLRPIENEQVTAVAEALHNVDPPTIVLSANP